jgi:hypothetical protein
VAYTGRANDLLDYTEKTKALLGVGKGEHA